jgi:hypothetical protein
MVRKIFGCEGEGSKKWMKEICKVRSFMISVLIRDCSGDQIKETEMRRA